MHEHNIPWVVYVRNVDADGQICDVVLMDEHVV